ncbi:MAG TPA: peptidase [Chloroflexi bacterium]|nr:peptidase [Chloroflexota bacterium]HHW86936.1 membrane dipeptidase [Chloroflexota bacterium]
MTNAFLSLHFDALVIDGHCDSIGDQLERKRWLGDRSREGHVDLPRLREGGVDVQFFACYVPIPYQRHGATTHALERLDQLHLLAERLPDQFVLARNTDDILNAKASGRVAGIAGLEGAEALDASIGVLRQFYRLGLRNLGLAWNHRNAACDGVAESRTNGGLTEFGVKVVEECNQLGIILDVSHLSPAGVADVLEVSQQPIIASHSNARALCDHPRNLTDAQLEAIAARGGVIGVTFVDSFLNRANPQEASLDDIVANIEHMLNVVGPDHVALGSDFDGWTMAQEITDATCYPLITQRLLERGHDPKVIRQILGENLFRVMRIVME